MRTCMSYSRSSPHVRRRKSRGTSFPQLHGSPAQADAQQQQAVATACKIRRRERAHYPSNMSSSSVSSSPGRPGSKEKDVNPIVRNALRYSLSPREYQLLHQYLLSRAPAVRKRTLPPKQYDAIAKGGDDYNAAAIRASLRLAVVAFSGLKAWDLVKTRLLARGQPKR